jgi:anti-sigma regulatory factor (Ser/Thr protein kinase)
LDAFHHVALMYEGPDEFVAETAAFLREGLAADEPVMVMIAPEKIELLRAELGEQADAVRFVDMTEVGRNPAWIIPAWREFARENAGRTMRGVGEPIWAARSSDELVECQRHESLLNYAFADAEGFRLLCPYDVSSLDAGVVAEARRSHPFVTARGAERESPDYRGSVESAAPSGEPLPEPRTVVHGLPFNAEMIDAVRRTVERHAARVGLDEPRREDLVLAVNEIASNSVRHGGGYGRLRVWAEDDSLICEIRDRGRIDAPLAGRERPAPGQPGGYGLWLAHQVCDLVQVRALPEGGVVRLHMAGLG